MKRSIIASMVATTFGAALALRATNKRRRTSDAHLRQQNDSQRFMMYYALPVWALAGVVDWYCHRRTKIETTSGPKESIMHLLMMAESGVSVVAGLFLQPNAAMFSLMAAGVLLHQATGVWDVDYTVSRRKIPPLEQHTHAFMETLPFDIVAVYAVLHRDEFLSLLHLGPQRPDFSLRLRKPFLPLPYLAAVFGFATLISGLPHVEELWRCVRARKQGLTGIETPACARELYGGAA